MGSFPRKRQEILAVLHCLGFQLDYTSGRGDHYKFIHPTRRPIVANQPPFIMVPRHDVEHGHLAEIIKRELLCFGFSKKEIKDCL